MKFSANLGFLWNDRSLPDAVRAAKVAGFDAVECHWPYAEPAEDIKAVLIETGLVMLGLNTQRGDVVAGENGLSAIVGRDVDARAAIDEAIVYADIIGAPNIHVMSGFASGVAAKKTFVANLKYACEQAAPHGITILIEPINKYDAPGYFLSTTEQAIDLMNAVGAHNLQLMFDCYHVQLMEGDLTHRIEKLLPLIGHIQIASVPDRGAPDHGEVDFAHIYKTLKSLNYTRPIGVEYKPTTNTDDTLGWLTKARQ